MKRFHMSPFSRANTIETLVGQLEDLLSAQAADLREYAGAVAAGQGTIHLERSLHAMELRRADLYKQFEEAAFNAPPIVAPGELDLAEEL
jgi:hypothetical protein